MIRLGLLSGYDIEADKASVRQHRSQQKTKNYEKDNTDLFIRIKIETFSPVSMALWVGAMALSLYTPHEGNLYKALLHIKAVLVCPLLGMLLIKILLLRKLDTLFDIVTLIILMSSLYSMS